MNVTAGGCVTAAAGTSTAAAGQQQNHQQQQNQQQQQQQQQRREIAIFWDYENVPLPDWSAAAAAAKAIVDAVSSYGRIVDRRLYFDFQRMQQCRFSSSSFGPRDSSGLDSSGFDLVNTPGRNQKETLDKKLIADVLTFAWDSAVRNDSTKPCVVLLTSDGDYAYTLSKLRDRGVMTIVMVGKKNTVSSLLVDTADVAMTLEELLLASSSNNSGGGSGGGVGNGGGSSVGSGSSPPGVVSSLMKASMSFTRQSSDVTSEGTGGTGTGRNGNDMMNSNHNNDGNTTTTTDYYVQAFCRSVQKMQRKPDAKDEWVDLGGVLAQMQQMLRRDHPMTYKEKSKEIRDEAQSRRLVEIARRVLDDYPANNRFGISGNSGGAPRRFCCWRDPKLRLSNEMYVRLKTEGENLCRMSSSSSSSLHSSSSNYNNNYYTYSSPTKSLSSPSSTSSSTTTATTATSGMMNHYHNRPKTRNVFCLNLNGGVGNNAQVRDFVRFLERQYGVTVTRALLNCSGTGAHVELEEPAQASVLLEEANKAAGGRGILYLGQGVGVLPDSKAYLLNGRGDEQYYYEMSNNNTGGGGGTTSTDHQQGTSPPPRQHQDDVTIFCNCLHAASHRQEWVRGAKLGLSFRLHLPREVLETVSKETVSARYKRARDIAVQLGLVEVGRRVRDDDTSTGINGSGSGGNNMINNGRAMEIVPLSMNNDQRQLTLEDFVRMLPAGRAKVEQRNRAATTTTNGGGGPPTTQDDDDPSASGRCVFFNFLPLSATAAEFLEYLRVSLGITAVERIELRKTPNKGPGPTYSIMSAHVLFETRSDAAKVLHISRTLRCFYKTHKLYVTENRSTPDDIARQKRECGDHHDDSLTYTREIPRPQPPTPTTPPPQQQPQPLTQQQQQQQQEEEEEKQQQQQQKQEMPPTTPLSDTQSETGIGTATKKMEEEHAPSTTTTTSPSEDGAGAVAVPTKKEIDCDGGGGGGGGGGCDGGAGGGDSKNEIDQNDCSGYETFLRKPTDDDPAIGFPPGHGAVGEDRPSTYGNDRPYNPYDDPFGLLLPTSSNGEQQPDSKQTKDHVKDPFEDILSW